MIWGGRHESEAQWVEEKNREHVCGALSKRKHDLLVMLDVLRTDLGDTGQVNTVDSR